MNDIRKIAVLRANALGDFIFALPALHALKSTFSRAEIVLLGRAWHREFLEGRPGPIDRVIEVPAIPGLTIDREQGAPQEEVDRFFARMREERFDLAIQIHGGGRYANPFTKRLGAKRTIGLRTQDAALLDDWIPYQVYQNERLRYLEVVGLVGATPRDLHPGIPVTDRDRELSAAYHAGNAYAVLHPGASDPRRRWPTGRFAAVGDALARRGLAVYVTGSGPNERDVVQDVVAAMREPSKSLHDRLSLSALVGLLDGASILISNDTGPFHLAGALRTPAVGIYWCGNMIMGGPPTVRSCRIALSWKLICPRCGMNVAIGYPFDNARSSCFHNVSFVDEVSEEEVLSYAGELLGASS